MPELVAARTVIPVEIFLRKKKKRTGKRRKQRRMARARVHVCVHVCLSQRYFAVQLFNTAPVMTRIFHLRRDCAQNRSLFKKKKNLI